MIGIRAEDKNRWERRAPLTPEHVRRSLRTVGRPICVQASDLRVFPDDEYRAAGARIVESLEDCDLILGVKEVPVEKILAERTYVVFPHVTKAQPVNMGMLQRFLDLGCTLLDYERIADSDGRRLIHFGRFAGYAGMIDCLWALGRRLDVEGYDTPLSGIRRAHEYPSLDEAREHLLALGRKLARKGLPDEIRPVVVGFTGSGQVFEGARAMLHLLPGRSASPEDLEEMDHGRPGDPLFLEVDFRRHHRFQRVDRGGFDAREFREHPERYRSIMDRWLPSLTMLIHGAYWEAPQPRLVTAEHLRQLGSLPGKPRLRVLGDISCDIGGGIEVTLRATDPEEPVFVYDIHEGRARTGVEGRGPVVLAVDNLPCELPRESSEAFSQYLAPFVPSLAACDWDHPFEKLDLPPELHRSVILHRGALTPRFAYLRDHLAGASTHREIS